MDDPHVVADRHEIMFSVEYERKNATRWRDIVRGRTGAGTKTVRRLLLGSGTQAMQQLGGINIMSYYLPTLLQESVGLDDRMARLITACASVAYLAASLVAAPMVERFGRRKMMLASTAVQFFCFLLMTVLLYYTEKEDYAYQIEVAKASVVWFFIYLMGFGLGMLGIPWLYPTEINSLPMRTKGAAVATMTDWLTNFIVVEVTPIGLQSLGWKFYIIWTVINAVSMPILYLFYPETANRTLEDLDAYYREDPPLLVCRDSESISVRRPARFILAHDRDVEQAAGDLRRRSVLEHNAEEKSSAGGSD